MGLRGYMKLVRDRIPDIIRESGEEPVCGPVDREEAIRALEMKLAEELEEYQADHSLEEMADLLEVMHGILYHRGVSWEELERIRLQKREARGGFEQGIFLVAVKEKEE